MNIVQVSPVSNGQLFTVLSAAAQLSIPDKANAVYLQAFTQDVRFTLDGTTATTTNLLAVIAGEPPLLITFPPGTQISVIEATASASLAVQWAKI